MPNKYGVNEFKSDFSLSNNMISGNYATQPVENLTVTISDSKIQIKYSNGVDFNNNLFEGTKYIFDISKLLDTEHSFSFSITERGTHGGGVELTNISGIEKNKNRDYIRARFITIC